MEGMAYPGQTGMFAEMNEILSKKEELFQQREEQIAKKLSELSSIEERLVVRAKELKQEQENFRKEKADAEAALALQKEEIAREWEEVRRYEDKCKDVMSEMLKEQVKLQELSNTRLTETIDREKELMDESVSSRLLEELMADIEDAGAGTQPEGAPEKSPELQAFEDAAKKVFPRAYVVESTPERFSLKTGEREIRVFLSETPQIHIVENRKSDRKLGAEVVQLNRIQQVWQFSYADNHLTAVMAIPEEMTAEAALQQTKKAISGYFKN